MGMEISAAAWMAAVLAVGLLALVTSGNAQGTGTLSLIDSDYSKKKDNDHASNIQWMHIRHVIRRSIQ